MNVFLRELKAYRKSTIIWACSLSAIVIAFMALYPAFSQDVAATRQIFEQFPAALRSALNLSLENFFTVFGFYGYLLSFAVLAASIQAMNVGTGIISKEDAGKTADFLLSKPVTRTRVMTAKLLAALTVVLLTAVVFSAVSYLMALSVAKESFDAGKFLLIASTMPLVQLMFLALGALFSVTIPKIKSVVSVSLPTVFAFYIVGIIGDVLGNDQVRYVSPFRYYDTSYAISHAALESRYLFIEAAFIVVAIAASYLIYVRKDIRAAS